jgi:hypothetical protein
VTLVLNDYAWNSYTGGNITLTVPTSGTIVTQAGLWLLPYHDLRNPSAAQVSISTTNHARGNDYEAFPVTMLAGEGSGDFSVGPSPQGPSGVAAGTHTCCLSGFGGAGWCPVDPYFFDRLVAACCPG